MICSIFNVHQFELVMYNSIRNIYFVSCRHYDGLVRFNCCSIICQFNNIGKWKAYAWMGHSHFNAYIVLISNKFEMKRNDFFFSFISWELFEWNTSIGTWNHHKCRHIWNHCCVKYQFKMEIALPYLGTAFRFTKSISTAQASFK